MLELFCASNYFAGSDDVMAVSLQGFSLVHHYLGLFMHFIDRIEPTNLMKASTGLSCVYGHCDCDILYNGIM